MTEATIFDTEVVDNSQKPTIPTEVAEFVGDGKKYSSVEDALKSIPHAQTHIQKLEEEMKQAREELARRKTAEELLEEMKSTTNRQDTPATLDVDALSKAVEAALTAKEAQRNAQQNIASVVDAFNKQFGEKGPEQYKMLAQENGVSLDYLNKLAATSPKAVMKLAGMEVKQGIPGKTAPTVNTTNFAPNTDASSMKVKMVGSSTKDLVRAWRAIDANVKQELGIKE